MYIQIIAMALFQGIAEFLPISSSGHLELLGALFNIREDERLTLSVILHAGTLFSMLVFYFKDIIAIFLKKQYRLIGLVIVGSVPAGLCGAAIKILNLERFFHNLYLVGICFILTGFLLYCLKKIQEKETEYVKLETMSFKSALWIGLMQAVAILPGVSRSGSTIFAGAKNKLQPEDNAKFSFFLAMAAIGGAALLEFLSLLGKTEDLSQGLSAGNYIAGFAVSFASGYLALSLLLKLLKSRKIGWFSIYLFLVGALTLILNIWK